MSRTWDDISLRAHAQFVIGLLVGGVLVSMLVQLSGRTAGAWTVAVVFAGGAAGALLRLSFRLRDLEDAAGRARL